MRITWDPAKRAKTLAERGLDFADAAIVFDGVTVEVEDTRKDYGETRIICFRSPRRTHGRGWLRPTGQGSPHFQHEEGQWPRTRTPRAVLLKSDLVRVDAPYRQCQGVSRTSAANVGHACPCQGEKRRPSTFTQSAETHLPSTSCGRPLRAGRQLGRAGKPGMAERLSKTR